MGNVHMEAAQINYRGGEKKMSVEEALKSTSGELAEVKSGLTNINAMLATADTITRPTAGSNVTITSGGYSKIGKMVIVDIQFTVTDTVPGEAVALFFDLPSPGGVNIPLTLSDTQAHVITSTCRIYGSTIYSGVSMAIDDSRRITGCYLAVY